MRGTSGARVLAPAKVNLLLDVLARRGDGYHDLFTVFQSVSLYDEVEVELGEPAGLAAPAVSLALSSPSDLGPVEDNLAYRAARLFLEDTGLRGEVRITLRKRIPPGAGLGGGSSDAAAVLRCLVALTGAGDRGGLADLALELGSDVPFFLGPATLAVGRGRGERLGALAPLPPAHLVLALPPVHVSTGDAYGALARSTAAPGDPVAPSSIRLLDWDDVAASARNDFEAVVAARHPEVGRALEALRADGCSFALLSGSGGACFGRYGTEEAAAGAASRLADALGFECVAVHTLREAPRVESGEGSVG